jgi:hypothetical protein
MSVEDVEEDIEDEELEQDEEPEYVPTPSEIFFSLISPGMRDMGYSLIIDFSTDSIIFECVNCNLKNYLHKQDYLSNYKENFLKLYKDELSPHKYECKGLKHD